MVKSLPFIPTLFCEKKIGLPSRKRIIVEITIKIGDRKTKAIKEKTMSNVRLRNKPTG
jgi:hypothetical protein